MNKLKVLFVYLPSFSLEYINEAIRNKEDLVTTLTMPLGILYLSSFLKKNNDIDHVGLLDYCLPLKTVNQYESVDDYVLNEINKQVDFIPDIIGISLVFSASHTFFEKLMIYLKKLWNKSIIVLGGEHATNCTRFLLRNISIDYIIRGEGENAFSEFVRQYQKGQYQKDQLLSIKGCYSKDNCDNSLKIAEPIANLDSLPFPDWELINIDEYLSDRGWRHFGSTITKKWAPINTLRGCPYKCTFCSSHTVHGRKIRYRSVKNVIEEIKLLHALYGVSLFIPEDDLFTANKKRTISLLNSIEQLNIPGMELQFPNGLHVNSLTPEIIRMLIKCGTTMFSLAIESGSEYVQTKIINKNCDLKKARDIVKMCREYGIISRCFVIIGFPGETKELLHETYHYFKTIECDYVLPAIATPLVGSELYSQFLQKGYLKNNDISLWSSTFFDERNFDTEEISAKELIKFKNFINYDLNFVNNINLRKGNYEQAVSFFERVVNSYPFHIFAWYGLYVAHKTLNQIEQADQALKNFYNYISSDSRSKEMYMNHSNLIPKITDNSY